MGSLHGIVMDPLEGFVLDRIKFMDQTCKLHTFLIIDFPAWVEIVSNQVHLLSKQIQ